MRHVSSAVPATRLTPEAFTVDGAGPTGGCEAMNLTTTCPNHAHSPIHNEVDTLCRRNTKHREDRRHQRNSSESRRFRDKRTRPRFEKISMPEALPAKWAKTAAAHKHVSASRNQTRKARVEWQQRNQSAQDAPAVWFHVHCPARLLPAFPFPNGTPIATFAFTVFSDCGAVKVQSKQAKL